MLACASADSKPPVPMAREAADAPSRGQAAMAYTSRMQACMRLNLKLEPPELEREFWRSAQTRRALQLADTIACILALVHVLSALKKFFQIQSSTATAQDYPAAFTYYYTASNIGYSVTAGLPLLLMALHPAAYHHHRYRLAVASRLLRAVNSTVVLYSSTAAAAIARALASRILAIAASQQYRPYVALLFNAIQPAVFFAQQAMFIVPWRWTVPLQLLNFRASLFWSARIPCVLALQQPGAAGNLTARAAAVAGTVEGTCTAAATSLPCPASQAGASIFFQAEASSVCRVMHYLFSLLGSLIGDVQDTAQLSSSSSSSYYSSMSTDSCCSSLMANCSSSSSSPLPALQPAPAAALCEGHLSVQVLQVLVSVFLFLVVPLVTVYWWEYTWKCSFLKTLNLRCEGPGEWLWRPVLDQLSDARSSRGGGAVGGVNILHTDTRQLNGHAAANRVLNSSSRTATAAEGSAAVQDLPAVDVLQQKRCFLSWLCVLVTVSVIVLYAAWSLANVLVWYLPRQADCTGIL